MSFIESLSLVVFYASARAVYQAGWSGC